MSPLEHIALSLFVYLLGVAIGWYCGHYTKEKR